MKKLCLLIALVASPAFAQEEEQEVQIEIESGGSPGVSQTRFNNTEDLVGSTVATLDGSVWYRVFDRRIAEWNTLYCHVNEDENCCCKQVKVDD